MRMRLSLWAAAIAASLCFTSDASSQWLDLGNGLAGAAGIPALTGLGPLLPTAGTKVEVTGGAADATGALVVGYTNLGAPFKGGVMVPFPNVVLPIALGSSGAWSLIFSWPIEIPAGFLMYWQAWLKDAGGPAGFAASNALQSTAS
jgi:hypothetical protein